MIYKHYKFWILSFLTIPFFLFIAATVYSGDGLRIVRVLHFQKSSLTDWKAKVFQGKTKYKLVKEDRRSSIRAVSQASASAFYKEQEIDIRETPYLTWSWKIDEAPDNNIEKIKAGDDFPARVYIIVKDGIFPWQTKAINYVWAMNEKEGSSWPNPFTSNVMMKAVSSGKAGLGEWKTYKVNVYDDLKLYFGKNFDEVNGIAIMTDMDNTGKSATAYYGEVTFTEK